MTKFIGELIWWLMENWGKIIGYPLIAVGLLAFAVVFPYVIILYLIVFGSYLISDR